MDFIDRFFHSPKQSFFLFGPRGTGKSTWLKRAFPNGLWIDLLDLETVRLYEARPERLREVIDANPKVDTVIIDEIQKIPSLLSMVHLLIESDRQLQFILTGSSTRKLRRDGVNLLAGRALLKKMHPFMASELKDLFSLEHALQIGMLPLVWGSISPVETLRTYAGLYLKEEVQAEGLVRQIGNFARFLEIVSFSHGATLNATNISRECEVKRRTVENYLQILDDLLLSFTLPVFTKRAQRSMTAHPKFYLFDAGVYRSLRPSGPLDRPEEIDGAALEGLVVQHLRSWADYQAAPHELYFWRTRTGMEVDFVVYGPSQIQAIEVKNTKCLSPKDLNGLKAFKKDYPQSDCLLLYRGKERLKQQDIWILPCDEFLRSLKISQDLFSFKSGN